MFAFFAAKKFFLYTLVGLLFCSNSFIPPAAMFRFIGLSVFALFFCARPYKLSMAQKAAIIGTIASTLARNSPYMTGRAGLPFTAIKFFVIRNLRAMKGKTDRL